MAKWRDVHPHRLEVVSDPTVYEGGGIDFDTTDRTAGGIYIKASGGVGAFQLNLGNEHGSGGWSQALDAGQLLDLATAAGKAAEAILAFERDRDAEGA